MARYITPHSLAEALQILGQEEHCLPLAGGTDLTLLVRDGTVQAECLLDISKLPELIGVQEEGGEIRIGPCTTLADVASSPLLPAALRAGASWIGSPQIRALGTIGGNICNASPCGDTLSPLLVLGGRFRLRSASGEREIPAEAFFLGPKRTILTRGELLVEISLPLTRSSSQDERRSAFQKIGGRGAQTIAQVNLAISAYWKEGILRQPCLAVGSAAPTPIRIPAVERILEGQRLDRELIAQASLRLAAEIRPICDQRASDRYRRSVVQALFRDALASLTGQEAYS
ncbi:MAG: xanthine dehydrogenase family protein subunit M [Coprothermobacterota bacterium]|nr:xanthine dehydrogenase family protein subunit M [Coprothermobacterota bacterium]